MVRVLHTADTHIGYRQYHSDDRRRDFQAAFDRVIDDAIDEGVDAVVHAGDLFHDKRPDLRDLQGTIAALARLRAADIPFLGIVGNHERKRDAQWLDLLADLGLATRLGAEATTIDGVAFYGMDYLPPAARSSAAVTFSGGGDAECSMLVGHGIIEGLPYGDWDLDALLASSPVRFDAVLLGDYHEHVLERRDGTVITYPGSTERTSADERGKRGYNLVTAGEEVAVSHRTLQDARRFVYVDVELDADEAEERVLDRLAEYDLEGAVAIITLEGDGGAVSPGTIEAHARDAGAIVARLRDRRERTVGAADGGPTVSFGDPDRAVREAIAGVELSEAAHELDDLVRDRSVPDSRVRALARERIEALLESDPRAIGRTVDDGAPARASRAGREREATGGDDGDGEGATPAGRDDPGGRGEPDDATGEEVQEAAVASGGQASMEDYL